MTLGAESCQRVVAFVGYSDLLGSSAARVALSRSGSLRDRPLIFSFSWAREIVANGPIVTEKRPRCKKRDKAKFNEYNDLPNRLSRCTTLVVRNLGEFQAEVSGTVPHEASPPPLTMKMGGR